jgi:negative regulator of flagellin synthesis FlgM
MSNKIVPVDRGLLGKVNQTAGKVEKTNADGTQAGGAASASEATQTDIVELTGNAKLLAQAEESLAAIPAIDEARVAEVRQAILDGDYAIDAEKIAAALLRTDLEVGR